MFIKIMNFRNIFPLFNKLNFRSAVSCKATDYCNQIIWSASMRLREHGDPICNYRMEIFKDFEEQLKKNSTEYLKNICAFENYMEFHGATIRFVDSVPINLVDAFTSKLNPVKICEGFGACEHLQDDIKYFLTNRSIEVDGRFNDEGNDHQPVDELQQSEKNRSIKSNDDIFYKSNASIALINAVMINR